MIEDVDKHCYFWNQGEVKHIIEILNDTQKENKVLLKDNGRLTEENRILKSQISSNIKDLQYLASIADELEKRQIKTESEVIQLRSAIENLSSNGGI